MTHPAHKLTPLLSAFLVVASVLLLGHFAGAMPATGTFRGYVAAPGQVKVTNGQLDPTGSPVWVEYLPDPLPAPGEPVDPKVPVNKMRCLTSGGGSAEPVKGICAAPLAVGSDAYVVSGDEYRNAQRILDELGSAGRVRPYTDFVGIVSLAPSTKHVIVNSTLPIERSVVAELRFRLGTSPLKKPISQIRSVLVTVTGEPVTDSFGLITQQSEFFTRLPNHVDAIARGNTGCLDWTSIVNVGGIIDDNQNVQGGTNYEIYDPVKTFNQCSLGNLAAANSKIWAPLSGAEVDSSVRGYPRPVDVDGFPPLQTGVSALPNGYYDMSYRYDSGGDAPFQTKIWALLRYAPLHPGEELPAVYYSYRRVVAGPTMELPVVYNAFSPVGGVGPQTGFATTNKSYDTRTPRDVNIGVSVAYLTGLALMRNEPPSSAPSPMGSEIRNPGNSDPERRTIMIDDVEHRTTYAHDIPDFTADAGASTDPVDSVHHGLLDTISRADLSYTDLFVFTLDGQMIFAREGLPDPLFDHTRPAAEQTILPRSGLNSYETDGLTCTQTECKLLAAGAPYRAAFRPRAMVPLRFGASDYKVIIVNRATGYLGSTIIRSSAVSLGQLSLSFNEIILRPPNLKVIVTRMPDAIPIVEHQIGTEGSGLTTDKVVSVRTEWFDWDGSPLPPSLPGYTGRLARVFSEQQGGGQAVPKLQADNAALKGFEIKPNAHTEVVKLPNTSVVDKGHFYLHVSAARRLPSFEVDFDETGANDTTLRHRPKHYVPVLVPLFDNAATKAARQLQSEAPPVYRWVYRPEMEFSLLELEKLEIVRKNGTVLDLREQKGALLPTNQFADLRALLTEDMSSPGVPVPMLEPTRPDRQLIFEVGGVQVRAVRDEATHRIEFLDPEVVNQLSAADLAVIRLYQEGDEENVLWQSQAPEIKVQLESGRSSVAIGDTAKVFARTRPEKDMQVKWSVRRKPGKNGKTKVGPRVRIQESEKTNHTALLRVDADSGEGFVLVRATSRDFPSIFREEQVYVGCANCANLAGAGTPKAASIDMRLSMGKSDQNGSAGNLFLEADDPSPDLWKPGALQFSSTASDVTVVNGSGGLSQIMAPQALMDLKPEPFGYKVQYYRPTPAQKKNEAGRYDPPSVGPFVSWHVENPTQAPDDGKHIRITETRTSPSGAADSTVNEFEWVDANNGWTLHQGGLVDVIRKEEFGPTTTTRLSTVTTQSNTGVVASVVQQTYDTYSWGEELAKQVIDPNGLNLTTMRGFLPATLNCNASDGECVETGGKLEYEDYPDDSWVHYTYDVEGLKRTEARPWVNSTRSPSSGRVTSYDYTPVVPGDVKTFENSAQPRTVTEAVGGQVISKTFYGYVVEGSGDWTQVVVRASAPGADVTTTTNERTETKFKASGTEFAGAGEVIRRVAPDGRLETIDYAFFDAPPGPGKSLRKTITHGTVAQPGGVPGKTTKEITEKDPFGNIVKEETQAFTASGYVVVGSATMSYDADGHLIGRVQSTNGLSSSASWDCCLATKVTDELGRTTTTTPDKLKRPSVVTTPDGPSGELSTTYTYDANGNVLTEVIRSGSSITRQTTNTYDPAGRIKTRTTPDGKITTWTYENNGRRVIVTRPGNLTEITETNIDGRISSVTGNAVIPRFFTYSVASDGLRVTEVRTGSPASPMFERTFVDLLGRVVRVERPGPLAVETTVNAYDQRGLLVSTTRPGLAPIRFEYDELGNRIREGVDVDGSGALDSNSGDRIRETTTTFATVGDGTWLQTERRTYAAGATAITTGTERSRLTNFGGLISETVSVDTEGNVTTSKVSRSGKGTRRKTKYPDSAIEEDVVSSVGYETRTTKTGQTHTLERDGLGRVVKATDPRTGVTETKYDSNDQVEYVKTPDGATTHFTYEPDTGRLESTLNALNQSTRFAYNDRGQLIRRWGSAVSPVEMIYDAFGRLHQQRTFRSDASWGGQSWPGASATGDTTTWNYQEATGLLLAKLDPASASESYTYETGGRPKTRTSARNTTTTYGYHPATGDLETVNYSDGTPDLVFSAHDRLGRPRNVTEGGAVTRTFEYDEFLRVKSESIAGHLIKPVYSTGAVKGRVTGVTLDTDYAVSYGYDPTGRLDTVGWNIGPSADTATYSYLPQSNLVTGLTTANGPAVQYGYEPTRNLRVGVTNTLGAQTVSRYDAAFDTLGRVKSLITRGAALENTTGAHWIYGYDDRNQLTAADRYLGTDPAGVTNPLPQHARTYGYDMAGNRQSETQAGEPFNYTPNPLDQYTSRSGPGIAETFVHDADGNLTSAVNNGAQTTYTYDAENRLKSVEPATPDEGDERGEYDYDYRGRRVAKRVFVRAGTSWTLRETITFIWDGWNVLRETKTPAQGAASTCDYVWGLDVSQSIHGAGGIGGLVASVKGPTTRYYSYDANGNVAQVTEGASVVAKYEYDPYGQITAKSGPVADENPWRFSTKYFDSESGFSYYGYRYYSAEWGRWTSRDPASDGTNLYGFTRNSPGNGVDPTGLKVARYSSSSVYWEIEPREQTRLNQIADAITKIDALLAQSKNCVGVSEIGPWRQVRDNLVREASQITEWQPTESNGAPLFKSPAAGQTSSFLDDKAAWGAYALSIADTTPPVDHTPKPPIYAARRVQDALLSRQCKGAVDCGIQQMLATPFGTVGLGGAEDMLNGGITGVQDILNGHPIRGGFKVGLTALLGRSLLRCEAVPATTFEGTLYRYERPDRLSTTWTTHAGNIANDHRYSGVGQSGVYGSTTAETALAEVTHYNAASGKVLVSKEVAVDNVLDLTNPTVREQLGVSLEEITADKYLATQPIGNWARSRGYEAILFPSARGPHNNLVYFNGW